MLESHQGEILKSGQAKEFEFDLKNPLGNFKQRMLKIFTKPDSMSNSEYAEKVKVILTDKQHKEKEERIRANNIANKGANDRYYNNLKQDHHGVSKGTGQ